MERWPHVDLSYKPPRGRQADVLLSSWKQLSKLVMQSPLACSVGTIRVIGWMHSRDWSVGVKHSPVITTWMCEWMKRAFLLRKKAVNKEDICELFICEQRKLNDGYIVVMSLSMSPSSRTLSLSSSSSSSFPPYLNLLILLLPLLLFLIIILLFFCFTSSSP